MGQIFASRGRRIVESGTAPHEIEEIPPYREGGSDQVKLGWAVPLAWQLPGFGVLVLEFISSSILILQVSQRNLRT